MSADNEFEHSEIEHSEIEHSEIEHEEIEHEEIKLREIDHKHDEALVRRFQSGDGEAFEGFVRIHYQQVFRLSHLFLAKPEIDAEDVTQEVFIRALKGLGRFRFRSTVFTWLYRTLKNVCQEHNRKQRKYSDRVEKLESDLLPSEEKNSEEIILVAERLDELKQLIESLPTRQREVFILRRLEQFSVEETARILGCKQGTIKAHLNQGLKKIEKLLEEKRDN